MPPGADYNRGQKAVFDAAPGKQKITDDLAEMEGHEQFSPSLPA